MFTASAPGLYLFAAQCPTPPILYLRFAANLTVGLAQDSRPSGSLLLSCKALSSSTFMPVYPGAQTSGLRSLDQVLSLSPRQHNAGDIAGQRNADSCERRTEKGHFAEHDITAQHCKPYGEKEGRSEEQLSVC